jgi:hypothetical protein
MMTTHALPTLTRVKNQMHNMCHNMSHAPRHQGCPAAAASPYRPDPRATPAAPTSNIGTYHTSGNHHQQPIITSTSLKQLHQRKGSTCMKAATAGNVLTPCAKQRTPAARVIQSRRRHSPKKSQKHFNPQTLHQIHIITETQNFQPASKSPADRENPFPAPPMTDSMRPFPPPETT